MYVGPLGGGAGGGAWAAPRFHSSSPTHSPPTPVHPNVVVRRVMTDPPCASWLPDPPPIWAQTPEAFCKRRPPSPVKPPMQGAPPGLVVPQGWWRAVIGLLKTAPPPGRPKNSVSTVALSLPP